MEPDRSVPPEGRLTDEDARVVDRVVQRLRRARRILVVTGAGMSADSGVPTYRGVGGLYHASDRTAHGFSIEEVLSAPMFEVRPDVTWGYLKEIERACRDARPNRGHRVLAEMDGCFEAVWILTQNVDGLHHAAGSRNVLDVHGDLRVLRCTKCDYWARVETYDGLGDPPLCPACSAVLRPDVVLFGESLDVSKILRLEAEAARGFDVAFSVGTSSLFDYVVAPILRVQERGGAAVEINPGDTPLSERADFHIRAGAAVALDRIWDGFNAWWPHT